MKFLFFCLPRVQERPHILDAHLNGGGLHSNKLRSRSYNERCLNCINCFTVEEWDVKAKIFNCYYPEKEQQA